MGVLQQVRWWGLLLVLAIPLPAAAESSVWQVETPAGALYLAGSVHVLRESDYPLPPEFEAAYRDSTHLVLETDLDVALSPDGVQQLLARGRYPRGETIADHVSSEVYRRLSAYCTQHHLPLNKLAQYKPWLLVMTLTTTELEQAGYQAAVGLDTHLHGRAVADRKRIHGLETLDQQLDALASLDGDGDAMVSSFLDEATDYAETLNQTLVAWRAGDVAQLEALVVRELKEKYPALYRALLVERNRRWLGTLERWARSGEKVMVVVGTAHLAGPDSVIALLRQRGYRVDPLVLTSAR